MTQRELKILISAGIAKDITYLNEKEIENISKNLSVIFITCGKLGMNGGLFKDIKTNKLYAITTRNTNLFKLT